MKNISPALKLHLEGGSTTLARCWKCIRKDGRVFGFTSTDVDIVFEGVTYEAATGFTPSAIQSKADLSVANLEVQGQLDSDSITDDDIRAGLWDSCEIEVFDVNYRDLTMGKMNQAKGKTGEIRYGSNGFVTELRGLAQQMQQPIGELYSPTCRADFGDARCKFDLTAVTITGIVTDVSDSRVFIDSSRTEPNDYFNHGKFTFTSGLNAGLSMEIKSFVSDAFELYLDMPYEISIGDAYIAYPGCQKRFEEDCRDRWHNVINFRGEPHVPGNDALAQVGGTT